MLQSGFSVCLLHAAFEFVEMTCHPCILLPLYITTHSLLLNYIRKANNITSFLTFSTEFSLLWSQFSIESSGTIRPKAIGLLCPKLQVVQLSCNGNERIGQGTLPWPPELCVSAHLYIRLDSPELIQ
jgi:hypothetical protein